ncbi:MAG: NlpC/P60 family protein [Acidobacteriota bacterium]
MDPFRKKAAIIVFGLTSALLAGCRTGARTVPAAPPAQTVPSPAAPEPAVRPEAPEAGLARMGYTVQVGAFALLDNARALAASLAAAGLDAFYFPTASGLFKVRFGNFPTRDAALAEARKLEADGRIRGYFIVGPADYAVFRPGPSGPAAGRPLPPGADIRDRLGATAESFIGVDYAWGGTTTRSGFDCSGLVLAVYQLNGLAMPRSVRDQFRAGAPVAGDRLEKGDLVFFSASAGGGLTHVGIYIGDGVFIHAPGRGKQVRRDSLGGAYFKAHFAGGRVYLK